MHEQAHMTKKIGRLVLFFFVMNIIILLLVPPSHTVSSGVSTSTGTMKEGQEAEALLKWKDSLDIDPTHSLLSSWKLLPPRNSTSPLTNSSHLPKNSSGGSSLCNWIGIICNQLGSVMQINLTSSNLRGTLRNFTFSSFPNLHTFVLYNNSLYGNIPSHISNLSRLTYLDLGRNHLTGNIPPQIGLLTGLQYLYLGRNHFNGSIPHEIGMMESLEKFYARYNDLSGSIPASIGNLSKLITLSLGRNSISGSIPHEIGQLKSIRALNLYFNNLTGSIPASIGKLKIFVLVGGLCGL
nr:probable leucine-rich repeat receptor-like protein kinase At1g35710 [Ziziphus jujuba var. spinosa]